MPDNNLFLLMKDVPKLVESIDNNGLLSVFRGVLSYYYENKDFKYAVDEIIADRKDNKRTTASSEAIPVSIDSIDLTAIDDPDTFEALKRDIKAVKVALKELLNSKGGIRSFWTNSNRAFEESDVWNFVNTETAKPRAAKKEFIKTIGSELQRQYGIKKLNLKVGLTDAG